MSLIERYLSEIARRLPKRQREDVRRELRSALGDALDGRVDGEPTEEDVMALLQEFGSPEAVAASYRPESQYLIGPALYPTFKTVTGVVLLILVSLVLLGFAVDLASDPPAGVRAVKWFLGLLSSVWDTVLSTLGLIVLIFAVIQRVGGRESEEADESWDPRELPEVRDQDLVGRGEAIVGVVLPIVFLVLLNVFRDHFGVIVNPGGKMLLNDVFQANLPWLNFALGATSVLNAWLLRAGRWSWPSRLLDWAIDFYWIWVLAKVAAGVATREGGLLAAGIPESVAGLIIRLFAIAPWVATVIVAVGVAKSVYRAFRPTAPRLSIERPGRSLL